jgi:putative DNA primase/helicase
VLWRVREFCRYTGMEAESRLRAKLGRAGTVSAVERLARSDRRLVTTDSQWDPEGVFAFPDGRLVDFNKPEIRRQLTNDLITKSMGVSPAAASCHDWLAEEVRAVLAGRAFFEWEAYLPTRKSSCPA